MKNYKILVKESDEREFEIEANSFYDARVKLEEKINNGEIVLDPYNYNREYENYMSKEVPKNFKMTVEYDVESKILKIVNNEEIKEFSHCFDIRDMREILDDYCKDYLENQEIEYKEELEEDMERNV